MIEKCIGIRRARQLHRLIRHSKVTFLCLLLTIVVLRGTIGAGKFGTPEQDFLVLRNRFASRKFHYRVLQDRNSFFAKEFRSYDNVDDNVKFALSSRLFPTSSHTNGLLWDDVRVELMEKHGIVRGGGKPRVLLVTGISSRKECRNSLGDYYLLKLIQNKIDYCRLHEMGIFYNVTLLEAEMLGFRAKLSLIRSILLGNPEVEFVWWMDSDAVFTDIAFEVPWERYDEYNLVVHGAKDTVFEEENWVGLNTGSFLIRNCQWSLDMIESWSKVEPSGKVRVELRQRTSFEADDHSATVYLLAKEKEKWGDKVFLENEYCLVGFWETLIDRYEKMLDRRWPLVTHFVGCKPCAKVGDYSDERCLKQIEKVFNLGGNQVLEVYGSTHNSLSSTRVPRLQDDMLNQQAVNGEQGTQSAKVS